MEMLLFTPAFIRQKILSHNGSVAAKYVQNSEVSANIDVVVSDGILHSNIDSGKAIKCNGTRAQIIGGRLRAKDEISSLIIGSKASIATSLMLGVDPSIMSERDETLESLKKIKSKINLKQQAVKIIERRKRVSPSKFTKQQEESLDSSQQELLNLEKELEKLEKQHQELAHQFEAKSSDAKIHVIKQIFSQVRIEILNGTQDTRETYSNVTLSYKEGSIKIGKLEQATKQPNRLSSSKKT